MAWLSAKGTQILDGDLEKAEAVAFFAHSGCVRGYPSIPQPSLRFEVKLTYCCRDIRPQNHKASPISPLSRRSFAILPVAEALVIQDVLRAYTRGRVAVPGRIFGFSWPSQVAELLDRKSLRTCPSWLCKMGLCVFDEIQGHLTNWRGGGPCHIFKTLGFHFL